MCGWALFINSAEGNEVRKGCKAATSRNYVQKRYIICVIFNSVIRMLVQRPMSLCRTFPIACITEHNERSKGKVGNARALRKALSKGYANQLANRLPRHNGYRTIGHKAQLVQVCVQCSHRICNMINEIPNIHASCLPAALKRASLLADTSLCMCCEGG